jgi:hypothetical protein
MLLVLKLAKLTAVVYRNTFRRKFSTHVFTGSSICNGVALRLLMARKPTGFYRLIYCTGLRRLGG